MPEAVTWSTSPSELALALTLTLAGFAIATPPSASPGAARRARQSLPSAGPGYPDTRTLPTKTACMEDVLGIGTSIFLIALGAILKYAVTATVSGVDLNVVGVILMIVGIVGLL